MDARRFPKKTTRFGFQDLFGFGFGFRLERKPQLGLANPPQHRVPALYLILISACFPLAGNTRDVVRLVPECTLAYAGPANISFLGCSPKCFI